MIIWAVVALLILCTPILVVRRSNLKTAALRAYGHELWSDRYDELVRWAESVAYPDRTELVVGELSDDVARELFPERFEPEPVTVPARISTGLPEDRIGMCIADREHDWEIERQHVQGSEHFQRVMYWCPECRQSFTEMVIVGELPQARVEPKSQVEQLRELLVEKTKMLQSMAMSWEQRTDHLGGHFRLTQEEHRLYLDVVRSAQDVKAALEQAKQVERLAERGLGAVQVGEALGVQRRAIAAAMSIPQP